MALSRHIIKEIWHYWGVFFSPSLWQLCPKSGGVAVAWITGTPASLSVQGHQLPQPQELWPYQRIFLASVGWKSEGLFG